MSYRSRRGRPSSRPGHMFALAALAAAALVLLGSASAADLPVHGMAFDPLEQKVDPMVLKTIQDQKLPGMSVAVTRNGRLILTKGYGYANAETKTAMTYMSRIRIGSVSKCMITGPCAYQVMKSKGIDPETKRLYGNGGVLGNDFQGPIDAGAKRYGSIVGISIDAKDHTFAWYTDGTYSEGATNNLDQYQSPRPFKPADGKSIRAIREIGITKGGAVYTWYDDGRLSIGTPGDLDSIKALSADPIKMPPGKSMLDVIGIDIAKSDDHVYAWFEDGTVSSGTSNDLDYYRKPEKVVFPSGSGVTRYNVRGIGIATNDHVYTWFAYGKACSGTTSRLSQYLAPYNYSAAPVVPLPLAAWYDKITIQNLLDHRSGFSRSGETDLAQLMFNVTDAGLTYEQAHRHFLTTRKLLFEPGTGSSYSNHGFGLWTLLIERLTGRPFASYARDEYLRPLGLSERVSGESSSPGSLDAWNHGYSGSKLVTLPFEQSHLGLAAGGFRSSARDLCWLMKNLDGKYTDTQLDSMGWGRSSKGKLSHNGRISGGTAFVAMFPDRYKSNNGTDLSRIHVAIATNIWADTAALEDLADQIVLSVPAAAAPTNYDVWDAKPAK